jgi:hypothetical protein
VRSGPVSNLLLYLICLCEPLLRAIGLQAKAGHLPIVANKTRKHHSLRLNEIRKRVPLIAASILAARKLSQYETVGPATGGTIKGAIRF